MTLGFDFILADSQSFVLVTGVAGFIGFHLSKKLLENDIPVLGFDNFNDYYDPSLKRARVSELKLVSDQRKVSLIVVEGDLEDPQAVSDLFKIYQPSRVVNLAAQAGVRYSLTNPSAYTVKCCWVY